MSEEYLSGSLAENLLVLLVFNDNVAPIIVNSVNPDLWESDVYKAVARAAIDYYADFHETPKTHIADLLESKLNDENEHIGNLYKRVLVNLFEYKDQINEKYVINQLRKFTRLQRLKASVVEVVELLNNNQIDEAENNLEAALKNRLESFDPGINYSDPLQALRFYDANLQPYLTGIKELDQLGIGPAPGELMVILAAANRGKSWFAAALGKACLMQRLKVLHITLEMSEELISQRYTQALFSLSKRQVQTPYIKFNQDEMGRFLSMDVKTLERPLLKNVREDIAKKLKILGPRIRLYIKRFPTNALTMNGIEAYLDSMERIYKFVPDVLIVDYADLMQLDYKNMRVSIGDTYKNLRRIAVERNLAVISPSQSNRLGEDAKVITLKHLGEDYSKAATADTIIAYCQTSAELSLGLARLFIAKARNEEKAGMVLLSQSYRIGQFCMDSIMMQNDRYWNQLSNLTNGESDNSEEETDRKPKPRLR